MSGRPEKVGWDHNLRDDNGDAAFGTHVIGYKNMSPQNM